MLVFPSPASADSSLNLVANDWEPYTGNEFAEQGLATQIVTTALHRAGYQATVTIVPWPRALGLAYTGKADGIVAIWSTRERREQILLSDTYLSNNMVLLHMHGKLGGRKTQTDLSGLHIGVGRGYDYSDQFKASTNFSLEPADRVILNLRKLTAGRIDMVLEDDRIARYNLLRHADEIDDAKDIEFSDTPLFVLPLYFGVNRHRPDAELIVSKFNTQLKEMQRDGTIKHMVNSFSW